MVCGLQHLGILRCVGDLNSMHGPEQFFGHIGIPGLELDLILALKPFIVGGVDNFNP